MTTPLTPDCSKTVIAFDYGTKKTGVAIGIKGHVRPLEIIKTVKGLPEKTRLDQLITQWLPAGFVVGTPQGCDLHSIPDKATAFANWLEKQYHLPAQMINESYSSCVIERKKGILIDHESAAIILRQWYQSQNF